MTAHPSELVTAVFKAMNSKDFTELEEKMTEDVSFDFPGSGLIEGKKRVILFMKALLRKYPVLEFSVIESIAEDAKACVIWTNRGRKITGEDYKNSGVTLLHFKENRISFISDYFKDTSFLNS